MSDSTPALDTALIADIYAAALGDIEWSEPLDRLRETTGSRVVALMSLQPGTSMPAVDVMVSDDAANMQSLLKGYTSEFYRHDPTPGFVGNWPAGRWFFDHQALSAQQRSRDVYYQEFLKPHGGDNWAGLFLTRGGPQSAFLSFMGSSGHTMTGQVRQRVDAVSDHFARALEIGSRLGTLRQREALTATVLDTLEAPMFLLDESGRLLLDNMAGRALSAQQPHALRFVQGRLSPQVSGWQDACWQEARKKGVLVLKKTDGTPLHLFLTPVPAHVRLAHHWERPLVLLSASAGLAPDMRMQRLRVLYGLTEAEAQLAVQLACHGYSPDECARHRGVAISTVRSQIKAILGKLRVARLALAIALVLSI